MNTDASWCKKKAQEVRENASQHQTQICSYIYYLNSSQDVKETTDKDFVFVTVQGENPLHSDRRHSGGGEAVM